LDFVLNEVDKFKERLSPILDIKLDFEKINLMIDNVKLFLQFSNGRGENVVAGLLRIHNYFTDIINKETKDYLTSINFKFPSKPSTEPVVDSDKYELEGQDEILDVV
jgi:hypothetical protein